MKNQVGIEMASVIPGFHGKYDIDDLVSCIVPRRLLIISAEDDKYSKDAPYIVESAMKTYVELGAAEHLRHGRFQGEHAMTKERYDCIVTWIEEQKHFEAK